MFLKKFLNLLGFNKTCNLSPYAFAFKTLNAAEELLEITKKQERNFDLEYYIGLLSMLELNIDASRSIVPAGSSVAFPEQKKEIEVRMNNLRREIGKLASTCNYDKLRQKLLDQSLEVQNNFLQNAAKNT